MNRMNMDMKTNRCRICLQNSTETFSIHAQVDAGVSYLDITLIFTKLNLYGSRNEQQHICVPCANMAKTVYHFKALCEGSGHELECNKEMFIQEKAEDVKNGDVDVTSYTAPNQCKTEDYLNLESMVKTENNTANCPIVSLQEKTIIVNENEQILETVLEDKNYTMQEALEIYHCKLCDKTFNRQLDLRNHSRIIHKLDKYVPESPKDYEKHAEAEHADKKTIRCNHCDKTFFNVRTLKAHLLTHNNNYLCEVCGSKFALKSHLKEHMIKHEQQQLLKCFECGGCYKSLKSLNSHIAAKKCDAYDKSQVYACKICDKKFTRGEHVHVHNRAVHNLHQKACHFCDFLPESPDKLSNHIAQEHADKKSLACKDCGKTFFELRFLNRHLLSHAGIKNHICKICGNKFGYKSSLKIHVKTHTGENKFTCSKCGRKFTHSSSLVKHRKNHGRHSSGKDRSNIGKQETFEIYVCKVCNKKFNQRSTLRKHNRIVHDIIENACFFCEYIPECPGELAKHTEREHADKKNFSCDQCDKTFFEGYDLKLHLHTHSGIKNYECEICNYKCAKKSVLATHMRKHTGEKPFQCSDCGKAFTMHLSLKRHLVNQSCKGRIKRTAKEARGIYSCKICDRKFNTCSGIRFHTRTVHNINQRSCFFCDYIADSSSDLWKHMDKEHTDKKTIACVLCDKAFFELCHLQTHMIVHNTINNHVCKICGHKFTMESSLTEHMTIHTGEKPFKCSSCDRCFRLRLSLKRHMGTHSDLAK